jgi:hypothetical protein
MVDHFKEGFEKAATTGKWKIPVSHNVSFKDAIKIKPEVGLGKFFGGSVLGGFGLAGGNAIFNALADIASRVGKSKNKKEKA